MPYTFKHGDRPLEGITVQRAVGRGGFGEVYYALADSGKQVALKYLRENPEIELRGIAHVMNLKSPHLITIYDVKHNPAGDPFVIMEYVSGPSLRELMLAEPAGFSVQKAAFFLSGIAKGLSYLHERGIVHRDLKPANIFYDDGYVKIGDYGLSKHMSVSKHSGQTVSVGTVHYMAPEIGSGNYTKAIDIYALGVILYEMLTGRLPYSGASMAEILMRHLRDTPDLTGIPQPFAVVIAKALAKDPKDRYQDADEMLAAVMESSDIGRSVDAFDATSLSQVPRSPEIGDTDPTRTSPAHPSPIAPLDARGPWPQAAEKGGYALPPRLQRKLDHLQRKLEQKTARLERKFGPRRGAPEVVVAPSPARLVPGVNRRAQVIILLLVTATVAVVLGLLTGAGRIRGPERAVALGLFMVGGTAGPLVAHLRFLQRSLMRSTFFDRLAYAAMAGVFMIPAWWFASDQVHDNRLTDIIIAPIAAIVICNWRRRIETGQAGRVDGWAAFWPGLIGLIACSIADNERYAWTAAGVCAAISLLTQAAASLWPLVSVAGPTPREGQPFPPGAPAGPGPTPVAERGGLAPFAAGTPPPQGAREVEPLGSLTTSNLDSGLVPRSPAVRACFGILATIAAAVSLGCFFALVIGDPDCSDVCTGLLFGTLAGIAWMPFLLSKALCRQRHRRSLWRNTLRMLVVSLSLTLAAGMIAALSFELNNSDEIAGAIFGLVVSLVFALVALCIPGRSTHAPAQDVAARTETPPNTSPPTLVTAVQPSFVGRATNAGLSLIGKVLLLSGVLVALGQGAALDYARTEMAKGELHLSKDIANVVQEGVPPGVALVPLAFGSLLLVMARRRGGAVHFFRGCLGCVALLWAALSAILWTGPALRILLIGTGNDLNSLYQPSMWGPLAQTGLALVVGVFLLLWPSEQRDKPIVI